MKTLRKEITERKVKIAGMGRAIGGRKLQFKNQIRYRLMSGESLLDLAEAAARQALEAASMGIEDIDIIVCAMATPLQAIPCNAALVHERIAKGLDIPAMDINTTCTSFLSAVDIFSSLVDNGRYERVLILSGDTASAALNPRQPESYELFSDGAAACVLVRADKGENSAVLYGRQKTWSEGAHDTEIRGGCGLMTAFCMNEENREDYYFDMKGHRILKLCARKLPDFVDQCLEEAGMTREEIRLVVPHQASRALEMIMTRLGFAEGTYIDRVAQYGNLVSASVPFVLCKAIEEEKVKRGDMILLMGTAAGLTVNLLLMRY
jgi:3-oxoacyl-[acyl-carrier-protein] synthase-3